MSFQQSANDNTYSQGPGESSSTLHGDALWIRGVNVSSRLMSARGTNMSDQSDLSEVHDLLAFIEDCFPDDEESEIAALLLIADVPDVPEQVISLFAKWALAAASQEYVGFQRMLRGSSLVLEGLAGDLLRMYTSTTALWPNRTQLPFDEDSYIKRSVMPMIDAVFGSLGTVERWRHQLPVPDGYEEVLQPNFYAEVDQLCFAIMEVRKPNAPKADIEDGARKLPCMMKIALNMLIHQDVQDPTVLGFQVSENTCEVFSLSLKYEAIYIPKSLGRFRLPQDQLDIPGLLPALGPLTAAKSIASTMVTSINRRRSHLGTGEFSSLTRPSYYVYGTNVPSSELIQSIVPHLRQSDLANCVRVSRSWNDALTPFLWRTLNIDSKRQLERFVTRQTQEALTRNALFVCRLELLYTDVLNFLSHSHTTCPLEREAGVPPDKWATCLVTNLCSVSIRFRHVPGDQKMKILALYQLNPGIRRLFLGSHAYGEWLPSNVTKYLPNLQELHLDGVWYGDVKTLLESLPECIRTVQLLAVRHSPTNQDEAAVEVKSLVDPTEVRHHRALESLRIEGDLADKEEEVLAPFLESCSHRLLSLEGLGSTIFLRPKVVEALLRIGFGWRMPERSRSVHYLSDARMAVLFSRSSQWREIHLPATRVGPLTAAAIANNCSHLEVLSLRGHVWSHDGNISLGLGLQSVLSRASRLKTFQAHAVTGREMITAENILSSEWATRSLEVLDMAIAVPRANGDAPSDGAVAQELCAIQRQVLRRIGQQKRLVRLILGRQVPQMLAHQHNCLEMTLESGLDELAGLNDLEMLDIRFLNHRVGVPELEWMAENLPKLRQLHGMDNCVRPPGPEVLQWLQTNRPEWKN
ncbi:hypothetical protein DFQ27_000158 [Actinomortierella ambigua]|uniref:F-box domain-containing protein n=1 Tax=Actinomortierella ambigua TaxID=1343610 RepID=A0A9P6UAE4_9FUNG|nr:hypothetical protein DFQ27_000158 [Actinomortierella ambigua]